MTVAFNVFFFLQCGLSSQNTLNNNCKNQLLLWNPYAYINGKRYVCTTQHIISGEVYIVTYVHALIHVNPVIS